MFLEDAYEATGYRLESDSRAALRPDASARQRHQLLKAGSSSQQGLIKGGWGDDDLGAAPLNRQYDPDLYQDYSAATRRNLARVDEARIDYDLLEDLVAHIDAEHDEGAILVFLPGGRPRAVNRVSRLRPHSQLPPLVCCGVACLPVFFAVAVVQAPEWNEQHAGMGEISQLYDRLSGSSRFRQSSQWIIPLHSTVSPADQRQARPSTAVKILVSCQAHQTCMLKTLCSGQSLVTCAVSQA